MFEPPPEVAAAEPLVRVMALHALAYCERLFYLEEVEEIRIASDAVYAGRVLHQELEEPDPTQTEQRSLDVASETLGLTGRIDAVRQRDGGWVPYEHKRGRCARGPAKEPTAWPSDRLQVLAYALLLEEAIGGLVSEGRIRYHASNATVRVPVDEQARADVATAVLRAIALYEQRLADTWRHPVVHYSLSYGRTIELESRLLEKEWAGEPGLFARAQLR